MTSRTFTQPASFLPSFKKQYTASTENVLEEFQQHQADEAKMTITTSSSLDDSTSVTDNKAYPSLLLRHLHIGETAKRFSRAVSFLLLLERICSVASTGHSHRQERANEWRGKRDHRGADLVHLELVSVVASIELAHIRHNRGGWYNNG
jgi:hypothetical protein